MSLGQLGAIRPEYHGQMTKEGRLKSESPVKHQMSRCTGKPFFCPQNVGYFHAIIVDDAGEMIGWIPIRFEDDKVGIVGEIPAHGAFSQQVTGNLNQTNST